MKSLVFGFGGWFFYSPKSITQLDAKTNSSRRPSLSHNAAGGHELCKGNLWTRSGLVSCRAFDELGNFKEGVFAEVWADDL